MADFKTVLRVEHHGRSLVTTIADLVWETTGGNPHVVLCGDGVFRTLEDMMAYKPVVEMPEAPVVTDEATDSDV